MSKQDWKQSQYYQADFLASHSVQPGSDEARKMTVTSGLRCLELYRRSDPVGSLVRMLLESSAWSSQKVMLEWKVEMLVSSRTRFVMRQHGFNRRTCCSWNSLKVLKGSDTKSSHLLFRLVPSMPRTGETDVQLLPTPTTPRPHDSENTVGKYFPSQKQKDLTYVAAMWPTPTARDHKGANSIEHLTREGSKNHTDQLANAVRLWPTQRVGGSKGNSPSGVKHGDLAAWVALFPTPTTRDYKSPDMNPESKRFSQKTELNSHIGGQLNPTWVEWLMGFPLGWTDLNVSETP